MHRAILKNATLEQLKDFVECAIDKIKTEDRKMYEELELMLHIKVYGYHFSDIMLEEALSEMGNEDGTKGGHWSLSDTTMVARNNGITFDKFNEYDWNYVMNMMYSDYYGSVPNETSVYVKMAKKFLEDKDATKGKALKYYISMKM